MICGCGELLHVTYDSVRPSELICGRPTFLLLYAHVTRTFGGCIVYPRGDLETGSAGESLKKERNLQVIDCYACAEFGHLPRALPLYLWRPEAFVMLVLDLHSFTPSTTEPVLSDF